MFLIWYVNVNKGVFCLINSYLRIKSYNVLNYNICSTDWSFPLIIHSSDTKAKKYENKKTKKNSKTKHANKQTSQKSQKIKQKQTCDLNYDRIQHNKKKLVLFHINFA